MLSALSPPGTSRTLVMGVVNVTPDSFSDGGQWDTPQRAIAHGRQLHRDGADIVDVGGESTRPGAARVTEAEEQARVIPVIEALAAAGVPVSVDTMRASVAQAAVAAGAVLVNDVSGGLADPEMIPAVATMNVPYVISHWRAHSDVMDQRDLYRDVVREVCDELARQVEVFMSAGGNPDNLVLDPGLGFAKASENNWPLLAHLDQLQNIGFPVLIGASRKRFLAAVIDPGSDVAPLDRDVATAAVTTLCAQRGVWAVRVHDVRGSVDAIRVVEAFQAARSDR
ncbi:dihydropteroate synthase [Micrococcales bacterium KH10]|nr:dihydropteroate synthase [Micrococcales bacterium KH10]